MRTRVILVAVLALVPLFIASTQAGSDRYLNPSEMVTSTDGRLLYVLCERADVILVVDTNSGKVTHEVAVGHQPRGLILSPDGKSLYVTSSWSDTVSVIDTAKLEVVSKLPTGYEPTGIATVRDGKTLYVANRVSSDISVIDVASGQELRRLEGGRGASQVTLSPEGKVYVAHVYPNIRQTRTPPQSEITVIDAARQYVVERKPLPNVAGVFHIAFSTDGKLGVASELRPKNLVPLAHVEHGWVFGNALTVFGEGFDGLVQVPLDELDRYFTIPYGVAITRDKAKIYVTSTGVDQVTVINTARLRAYAHAQHAPFVNDLSASANYVTARISTGRNPRGLTLSPDGKRLYVANRLDDSIEVIDTQSDKVVSTIDLGGSKNVDALRRGERIFNETKFSFQSHFSCANCHIDGTFDGLTWDLEPDGFGKDVVDNRLLEDLTGTEPFKWNGGNPDMPTECGPRTEKYFYRSQSYNGQELTDLVTYVMAQPLRPNRYRLPNGELTEAQERGKAIYERTVDKTGKPIAETNRCGSCHADPKFTDHLTHDVGSGKPIDRSPKFDTAHLGNIHMTAPYLHDGSARSLEEIWTVFNPNDTHGRTNDLTKDELNDLIEYLRTL